MIHRYVGRGLAAVMLCCAPIAASTAQDGSHAASVEAWGGIGRNSPQLGILGETPNMAFAQVALRFNRRIRSQAPEAPHWEWGMEIVPFARMSKPLLSLRGTGFPCPPRQLCTQTPNSPEYGRLTNSSAPTGIGGSPLVITRRFATARAVSPFVSVTGGGIWFTERVPTTKASNFNFTASAELGLRLGTAGGHGVTLAYRFHHISNAGTAGENPGLASHLLTVGMHAWSGTSRARP